MGTNDIDAMLVDNRPWTVEAEAKLEVIWASRIKLFALQKKKADKVRKFREAKKAPPAAPSTIQVPFPERELSISEKDKALNAMIFLLNDFDKEPTDTEIAMARAFEEEEEGLREVAAMLGEGEAVAEFDEDEAEIELLIQEVDAEVAQLLESESDSESEDLVTFLDNMVDEDEEPEEVQIAAACRQSILDKYSYLIETAKVLQLMFL